MADLKEALVPDIGGDKVPVIEVLVSVGDRVEKEQGLITLESDKATMEVPAPFAGTIKELKVKLGDEVGEGTVIAMIEADGAAAAPAPAESPKPASAKAEAPAKAAPAAAPAPAPASSASGGVREVLVPDIGDFDAVPVIEILVKAGDTVSKDQSLVTLESDKATMEVPAPFAGVIKEIKLKVGDEVAEGSLIALIESSEAAPASAPAPAAAPAPVAEKPAPTAARSASPGKAPEDDVAPPRPPFDAHIVMPGDAPYASPAIRAFARELGVDVTQVKGSGRGGRIQRDDVSAYVKHALASGARPVEGGSVAVG